MPTSPQLDFRDLLADARAFGRDFPSAAAILSRPIAEPTTERLVEGVTYLATTSLDKARDFQRSAHERLAERVCPWLLRPIPSATIVAFDAPGELPPTWSSGAFQFRPHVVRDARTRNAPGVGDALEFIVSGDAPLNDTLQEGLSLYVGGELQEALNIVHALTANVVRVEVASPDWPHPLAVPDVCFERAGLRPEDAMSPDPDGPPAPFGIVTEALVFPHKFRFVRLRAMAADHAVTREVRITIFFEPGVQLPTRILLLPNCTTATNLSEACADPVPVAFDREPTRLRVARGHVYAVRDVVAIRQGRLPVPIPGFRRLSSTPSSRTAPAMFTTSWNAQAELCIGFVPVAPSAGEGTASIRVLVSDGPSAPLRAGDLRGAGYTNVVAASRFVPPPTGSGLALRSVRAAAVRRGASHAIDDLRETLLLCVPSWMPADEWIRSMHARIGAVEALDVGVARRIEGGAKRLGYLYRAKVNEAAFQGRGEMGLFMAAIAEGLRRCAPAGTFVELHVEGTKSGVHMLYGKAMST